MNPPSPQEIRISAQPLSAQSCRFTVDRPIQADRSYYFANREQAEASPLARRLFEIESVAAVLISHDTVTIDKAGMLDWRVVGREVGSTIRAHIASGEPAISDEVWKRLPPADEIRGRVQEVLDSEINPAVASHGGHIALLDVRENTVFLQLGGGCQGCGMASVTLKQGVERAIRAAVPEVGDILDATDHASGRNPYYAPSKK